ncbi:polynucleotide adenylyltransferase PcnB [Leptospira selangorensis]|uniref:Poly(A) polymerase I n=1 Tax=Leptospira selangorensis TaxID=2484982 RepID=A0A4R9FXH4_9LEPT|nr:polynucleotide adenylyltransferase PcnB [Leptospira selangorensis]TGK03503.1 polynucleotide adenylyltransferase PcnB [Leptospira selangorensis]TGM14111.1 polynucleotide adenylyltransferase PcnB [Leptospira selangorensis]TGM26957.1 polynucleotide adenylyltransferase PcnB [Leptospira selangorensis]
MKFLSNLFKKKIGSVDDILIYPEGRRFYRDSHPIRKTMIDEDAVKIIHRLHKFGYKAYIVGGGVRDLLLGRKPKDFDVVTNATPNQIKKIFNNCRIIGRRFKIVHILFKGKVIEVSTFRSLPEHRFEKHVEEQDYLIKRDNKFGTPQEDAARRDFTINALYYDIRNDSIVDYVGGYEDIQSRQLRVIGNPDISFREDPVRMLRAVKFAVLLGLKIDKGTSKSIKKNAYELEKASSSRMLEEYNKIFRTWRTSLIFQGMAQNSLLEVLLKEAFERERRKNPDFGEKFLETRVGKRLAIADKLLSEREELTPQIFYALLFSDLAEESLTKKSGGHLVASLKLALEPIFQRLGTPKKDKERLIKVFASQERFTHIEDDKASQNNFFRKKDFFYDAFYVYKINAIADNNDKALQSAFFWEISLRKRPVLPNSIGGGGGRREGGQQGGGRPNRNRKEREGGGGRFKDRNRKGGRQNGEQSKQQPESNSENSDFNESD